MTTGESVTEGSDRPLVSAVVPTYGRNDHLATAVESIADQTYGNIELFVVDDGSPTPVRETLDIPLDRLTSVTFIRHEENRGANVARNSGIRAATGEYVAFLDDDDRWCPTKIERQVEAFLNTGPEVGVVYAGLKVEGPNGVSVKRPTASGDVMTDLLAGETFGQFSSVMVAADAIDVAGLPDERFPAWQDREWFFRLARNHNFKPVSEVLTHRWTGLPDSITKRFEQKRDVAYPLFVEKHYPHAREYGRHYARMFLASLRRTLGRSAIHANEYREARKYFLLSFLVHPLYRPVYADLLASAGGKWTYKSAASLRQAAAAVGLKLG